MLEFIPNISADSHVICMITYVATRASHDLVDMTYVTSHGVCHVILQLNYVESAVELMQAEAAKILLMAIF